MSDRRVIGKALDGALRRCLSERQYGRFCELLSRWLPAHVAMNVEPATAGGYTVSDGLSGINIVTTKRALLYRYGIAHRLEYLARRYTMEGFVSVEPGEILLDIGANIGEFILSQARKIAYCYAIEPDPMAAVCLKENLYRMGLQHEHFPRVLWKEPAEVFFRVVSETADSSISYQPRAEGSPIIATTLDSLLVDRHPATFIKMDVEGAEPEVIEGGIETFRQTRCAAIDCGPERDGACTEESVMKLLRRLGFDVRTRNYVVFARRKT